MKFAKWVFAIAGVYGLVTTVPIYFLEGFIDTQSPPPVNHPEYYYAFLGVVVAWQFAFLVMSRDPRRYRLLMLPAIFEKVSFFVAILVLVLQGRTPVSFMPFPAIDLIWGILFIISFYLTREQKPTM